MSASEEQVAAQVIAALTAANAAPYDLDDLANLAAPPAYYTEVTVSRRFGGNPRVTSESGITGWRVTTRQVAKTVSNAREMRKRTHAALEEQRVTAAGVMSSPIKFETAEPVGSDDGWYSGLESWTFTL